ncbi:MAG TPA: hypothetical protein PKK48_07745, partial [Phycisphaerae bacterium]|nr:hypothetical protein [Phycisphaerae bacterium]
MSIAIDSQPLQEQESQRMMALIAKAAPWTLSALLHVAILLVLLFTVFFTINDIPPAELDIRTEFWAETKPIIAASPMAAAATSMNKHSINPRADKALPVAIKKLPPIIAKKNLNNAQLSLNNPISNSAFDMHISAGSDKCFFDDNAGKTGRADNIVYVIDASGSMMLSGAAQAVRDELYRVLGRLSKKQFFGII